MDQHGYLIFVCPLIRLKLKQFTQKLTPGPCLWGNNTLAPLRVCCVNELIHLSAVSGPVETLPQAKGDKTITGETPEELHLLRRRWLVLIFLDT